MTRDVARAAFPKGCLAMRIRERLGPLFADEEFKEAFGVRGRPGVSPGQLALVSILQFAENLTDRQAAHAVRARIDVKYLLGLELTDPGFDHTVLTGFRDRLLAHGLEEKILDLLLERLTGMGLVASGGRQRTDSTHVLAAVRSLNRLEFVGETLRAALEALAAAAPDWMRTSMDPAWQERYGARVDAYRLPTEEQERREPARQIAADGYRLLEAVFTPKAPTWLRQVPAVTVLRTVWVQQFTRTVADGEEEVAWRGKDDLPPSRVLIASPYDPDARYAKKRGSAWVGYKIHVSESCDDPKQSQRPHLITHVVTTDATVNDAMVVDEVHDRLTSRGLLPGGAPAGCRVRLRRAAADRTGLPWCHRYWAGAVEQYPAGGPGRRLRQDRLRHQLAGQASRLPDRCHEQVLDRRRGQQRPGRDPHPLRDRHLRTLPRT
ncbi:transposase [Streptomyces sp. TRM68367]|uniref:transposase n=1 Tax=Streptomyces sp. TRM68367 TaxID=2758415 RepID=UPI0029350943|nr:transposase [Streptomyces sp. TRM68367]